MIRRLSVLMASFIQTAFRSEAEAKMQASPYVLVVYDEQDHELPVFVGDTQREVADFLGISIPGVRASLRYGYRIKRRYTISRVWLDKEN